MSLHKLSYTNTLFPKGILKVNHFIFPNGLYKLQIAAHTKTISSMLLNIDIGNSFLINLKVFKRLIACST